MKKDYFINYLLMFIGTPYKLGGNVTQDGGMDCSALILEGLRSVGLWNKTDARAKDIFNVFIHRFKLKEKPGAGDLLFFGDSRQQITHIAACLNEFQVIEAGGTDTDGMVRIRPISWRKDMVAIMAIF